MYLIDTNVWLELLLYHPDPNYIGRKILPYKKMRFSPIKSGLHRGQNDNFRLSS